MIIEYMYHLIVVGSGVAGLSAAMYAGRYRMKTLCIGDQFGGYTTLAGTIENYPGVKKANGLRLMRTIKEQGQEVGAGYLGDW